MNTFLTRKLAIALVITQVLSPLTGYATDLSDVPMAVISSVKPNVFLTVDDSGSMYSEIIPETIPSDPDYPYAYFVFPKPRTIYGRTGYYSDRGSMTVPGFEETSRYARFFRTARFNPLYYNPQITYTPWADPNVTTGSTPGFMPNASPAAARHNPYVPSEGTIDLTSNQTWTGSFWDDHYWLDDNGSGTLPTNGCTGYAGCGRSALNASRSYFPATYFVWNGATGVALPTTPVSPTNTQANFTKIEIKPLTATYTKYPNRTDCSGATCSYNEEIQNFANWYSYYRSRTLAARGGIGQALGQLQDNSMRVGYGTINTGSSTIDGVSSSNTLRLGVRAFSGADRRSLMAAFYGDSVPQAGTPLRQALGSVGQYFSRQDNRSPWTDNPAGNVSGYNVANDAYCRQNFNILMSDGQWNGNEASNSSARANVDGADGNPFADSYSNTLADVARYYYKTDLRGGASPLQDKVPTDAIDTANWQHLVTYTVGFGLGGTIAKSAIDSTFTATPQTITWPNAGTNGPNRVDDLAHAAVNGRGGYFAALDVREMAQSLKVALEDILGRNGSAAAVAVSNANVTSGDNASYELMFLCG